MIGKTPARTVRPSAYLSALLLSTALLPAAFAQPAPAAPAGSEEVTVTAQRKSETVQKVPIAVSAFGQDQLQKSKLDGGPDLVKAVPNVNFSKGNFTGYNFSIRGIGSKVVSGSGDAGTGIHINNAPEIANNLFETDFYDVERVEVLRGPQGTLYGRNATSGVVNLITAKPELGILGGNVRLEYGNFSSFKARGMVNIPIGEIAALRLAGFYLKRDGFGDNLFTGNDADDRQLFGARATLAFAPTDNFRMYLMVDHFNEDDNRSRIGKQFCVKDSGPANVGGAAFSANPAVALIQQGMFSQGCKDVGIYTPASLGTVDSRATLGGLFGYLGGFQTGDAYVGKMQTPDFHDIESTFDPIYRSTTDIYQLNADWDITDSLTASLLATYTEYDLYTRQDYNRYTPTTNFNVAPGSPNLVTTPAAFGGLGVPAATYAAIYASIFPGGVVSDPQNGNFNRFTTSDISSALTEETFAELRLASHFDGPINFSIGANYLKLNATGDYFVMFNTGTAWYQVQNTLTTGNPNCFADAPCVAIDPNQDPDRTGHNYYDAYGPYQLKSTAFFGEVYWDINDAIQIIGGIRYTDDQKDVNQFAYGSLTLPAFVSLGKAGVGLGRLTPLHVDFQEITGRAGFKWDLKDALGGSSNLYAFYSRGYKSGGLNSPCSAEPGVICGAPTFRPEFINSYEIGLKNQFLDNRLTLNLTGFYYDYKDYQISRILNRASTNDNIDAKIMGLEFEGSYSIIDGLRINAAVGFLDTEIKTGAFADELNLTGGVPGVILVKSNAASNCVVTIAAAQAALATSNAISNPTPLLGICTVVSNAGQGTPLVPGGPLAAGTNGSGFLVSNGLAQNLVGNELPNAPHWTISLGAQYTFQVTDSWDVVVRADYYHQTETFSRIFNSASDHLEGWDNINLTLTVANPDSGWSIDAYVKNATDETVITDTYLTDASSGLYRNGFVNDPRTFGVAVTKEF